MNNSILKNVMSLILFFIAFLNMFYCVYIFQSMWLWFFVPFGLMKLSFVHAFGIYCILDTISLKIKDIPDEDKKKYQTDKEKIKKAEDRITKLITFMIAQSILFLVAYICHLYM